MPTQCLEGIGREWTLNNKKELAYHYACDSGLFRYWMLSHHPVFFHPIVMQHFLVHAMRSPSWRNVHRTLCRHRRLGLSWIGTHSRPAA